MANTIRIKRRVSGATGAPASLENAELAFNEVDNTLYYGKGTGGAGGSASVIEAIAGSGAFATLTSNQTVSGNKTFTGLVLVPTVAISDSSTTAASTAFIKSQGYLTSNEVITVSGDASGSGTTALTLTLANTGVVAGTYSKVTVDSKGRVTLGTDLTASDIPALTSSKITDFDTQVRVSRLDQLAAPAATIDFNAQRITGLADPQTAQDAATKAYVDVTRQGLAVKDAVRAATTTNITLSGSQTVDGIVLVDGDRVLVKDQSLAAENGLYVVVSGAWIRAQDADDTTELVGGDFVFVQEGTTQADSGWVCTTNGVVVLGTTALNFTQFSGAGSVTAGTGLTKVGNVLNISLVPIANGGTGATTSTGTGSVVLSTSPALVTPTLGAVTSADFSTGTFTWPTFNQSTTGTAAGLSATLAVTSGGTGATSLTGLLKGNGTGAVTAATQGVDYLSDASTVDGGTY